MTTQKKGMTIAGWIIAGLMGLMTVGGLVFSLTNPEEASKGAEQFGWPPELMMRITIVQAVCVIFYLVPRTCVLGAVLLTGYFGGAVATHVRIHDNFVPAVVVGVLVWLGLYLRDPRVRALMPFRKPLPAAPSEPAKNQ